MEKGFLSAKETGNFGAGIVRRFLKLTFLIEESLV